MPQTQTSLDDVLAAVHEGFDHMEQRFIQMEQRMDQRLDRMDRRLDRIEKIVDNWPPPSQIKDLLSLAGNLKRRVEALEKKTGIKAD